MLVAPTRENSHPRWKEPSKRKQMAVTSQQSIRSWKDSERRRVTGGSTSGAIRSARRQMMHKSAIPIRIDLSMPI